MFKEKAWLILLFVLTIPIVIMATLYARSSYQNENLNQIKSYFLQRQNTVMAYDAMEVATGISDLLEKAARDLKLMAQLPSTAEAYIEFHDAQLSDYTQFFTENEPPKQVPLPFYNRQMLIRTNGEIQLNIEDGKENPKLKRITDCRTDNLCDRQLLEEALKLPVGELRYGRWMRWYSSKNQKEDERGANISVAYRGKDQIYILGIDYRHIKDHMTTPAFPYAPKRNLIQAYEQGNYIYGVDSNADFFIHPKYWNVTGIDRETGKSRAPMKNDQDSGLHPINVRAYENGVLKETFERFMTRSFLQKGVDLFQSINLKGMIRVLSVAPISLSKGQYKESGVFGFVVITCNLEFFEEPREKIVPYY